MSKDRRFFIIVFGCFIPALLLVMYISSYAGPWRGQVVDAETKQPIEGAVVVAVWNYHASYMPPGPISGFVDAQETVTDKDGRFEIPARRFMSVPIFRDVQSPELIIFKPGYGSFPQHQVSPTLLYGKPFEGQGVVVELPKATRSYDRVRFMYDAETSTMVPDNATPKLNKALEDERKRLGM